MDEPRRAISGFLNVDKPAGWTSSDVVVKLRSAFGLRQRKIKIGHCGTLDPMATGVLPICVGSATRLSEFVLGGTKTYVMSAKLGVETDTYDSDGEAVATRRADHITEDDLRAAIDRFVGDIEQVPPMYSAIKRDGKPLYKLARQGKTVTRDARKVHVSVLELTSWEPPAFTVRIECGSGFYARSLAHDIGNHLGCGSHMTALRREQAADFDIADAIPLDSLLTESENDAWCRFLVGPDHVLSGLDVQVLDDTEARSFLHGQPVHAGRISTDGNDQRVRVYSKQGRFLGVAIVDELQTTLKPKVVISGVSDFS